MSILTHRRSQKSMKNFYNRLFRIYAVTEKLIGPVLDAVVKEKIVNIPGVENLTALDYACGSGALTLRLATCFQKVVGRDQSAAMLEVGRAKAEKARANIRFSKGDILAIDEQENTFDWVFVSLALHLFPPEKEVEILENLLRVSRNGVMVIDHSRKWSPMDALVEWWEGSYYDQFIKTDFGQIADRIGAASFEEVQISKAMVLIFRKTIEK